MKTRPLEPNSESENPEQWCEILAWEEERTEIYKAKLTKEQDKSIQLNIELAEAENVINEAVTIISEFLVRPYLGDIKGAKQFVIRNKK